MKETLNHLDTIEIFALHFDCDIDNINLLLLIKNYQQDLTLDFHLIQRQ